LEKKSQELESSRIQFDKKDRSTLSASKNLLRMLEEEKRKSKDLLSQMTSASS